VLLATRDLLDARTVLIETKQQQLSAIVRAYQALGGGYLVSNSGPEFPELFCTPADIQLNELILPPASDDATRPRAPEILPPPQEPNPNR
jgi:outer membrane protein, multidrug efflux system